MEIIISSASLVGQNCQQRMKEYGLSHNEVKIIARNIVGEILQDPACPDLLLFFISEDSYGRFFRIVFTFMKGTDIAQVHTIIESSEEEHDMYCKK
jgi:hypothetical protein